MTPAICSVCGREMPAERLDFGLTTCAECHNSLPYLGLPSYAHKTAGVLMRITDPALFRQLKRPVNRQR